jgi:signal transduction histidine kinase/DNA-binding response OmpR family regulator
VTILLAVADPALRRVWEAVAAERGHEIRLAMPGLAAWQAFQDHRPALVVVERTVASVDAFELARRIRRLAPLPRPGIVILLQSARGGAMVAALKAGADDVLVGGSDPDTARSHLRALEWRFQPPAAARAAHQPAGYRWEELGEVPTMEEDDAAAVAAPRRRLTLLKSGDHAPPPAPTLTIDLVPTAALLADAASGRVSAANALAERLFAREGGLAGTALDELFASGAASLRAAGGAEPGGGAEAATVRLDGLWGRRGDGSEFGCEASAGPAGADAVLVLVHQTHARERRDSEHRETPKMEAVATLAKGVVNDFNNALAAISGSVEAAQLRLAEAGPVRRDLTAALDAARDAARLVRRLRQVADPAPSERRPADPQRLVDEALRVLRRALPGGVALRTRLDHGGWHVHADAEQLADILINLGRNGIEAMPSGGALTIATARILAGQADGGLPSREYVRFDVIDEGVGIAAELLPRIFDPFFTTKAPGGGAGLGLATVYGVLQQHGGGVTVETARGRGTIFHVFVPRSREPARRAPDDASPTAPQAPRAAPGTAGTILLVDDEASVRRPLRLALEHHGFRVVEAADGEEGLAAHASASGLVDLVVVDHHMPRLSGVTVLEELKRRAPALPVVLVSGHSLAELGGDTLMPDAFLRKPFELGELVAVVGRLLGRR